jgi:hypothetical protein
MAFDEAMKLWGLTITSSPAADSRLEERHVEAGRAVADGDGVRRADIRGEGRLELRDARALGYPAAADRLRDEGDLLLAHLGFRDGDHATSQFRVWMRERQSGSAAKRAR